MISELAPAEWSNKYALRRNAILVKKGAGMKDQL